MHTTKKVFKKEYRSNIFFFILILWFLVNIVSFPKTAIDGATKGLTAWFNIVVPSLLPFFIVSEILINLGFVELIGRFLEPIMIPIFNVPGIGVFPFILSIVSGYPVGVRLVSKLRQNNSISKIEAERLLSFSSTSGPLFMLGAVAVGMLNDPYLGSLIVYPHYLAALTLGIIFSFYKGNKKSYIANKKKHYSNLNVVNSKNKKNCSIGSLLANSVKEGTNSITTIGSFMILYSVFVEIIYTSRLFNILIKAIMYIMPKKISSDIIKAIFTGIIEITIGCNSIAKTSIPVLHKILIINFFIGWSGLSVHSQALSFLSKTDINTKLYIFTKLLHGILASIYGYILYKLIYINKIKPPFAYETFSLQNPSTSQWIRILILSTKWFICIIIALFMLAIILKIIDNIIEN